MILNRRPAQIGGSINSRTQKHGEDDVPAFDIPLEAIMLPKLELNALMRDETLWDRWFKQRVDGLPEPANTNLRAQSLTDVYEHSAVSIEVGLKPQLFTLEDCKIVKLKLTPCVGGLTELCLTVQALIDETNTALFEYLSKDCDVEITMGALENKNPKQAELALNAAGPGDDDDDGESDDDEGGDGNKKPKRRGRPRKNTHGDELNA